MNKKFLFFIIFFLLLSFALPGQKINEPIAHYEIQMTEYKVEKGKHDFKPNNIKLFGRCDLSHRYYVKFTEASKYLIDGEDQWDWLKGGGISNHVWTNHKNSATWAFRYNPKIDSFEIAGYFHVRGETLFPGRDINSNKIHRVAINDITRVDVVRRKKEFVIRIYDYSGILKKQYFIDSPKPRWPSRNIGSWFGGTSRAPENVSIFYHVIW